MWHANRGSKPFHCALAFPFENGVSRVPSPPVSDATDLDFKSLSDYGLLLRYGFSDMTAILDWPVTGELQRGVSFTHSNEQ